MQLIYLDQNKWIELARVEHAKERDSALQATLTLVRTLRTKGLACFPLSLGHYIETQNRVEPESRARLGAFMADLSDGRTVAPLPHVVRHEIEVALSREFPRRVAVHPFEYLGRGAGHAAGSEVKLRIHEPARDSLHEGDVEVVERVMQRLFEESLLTGWSPELAAAPRRLDMSRFGRDFAENLKRFRERWRSMSDADLRRRFVLATSLVDIFDAIKAVLDENSISLDELHTFDLERMTAFLERMPTRRIDMHLRTATASDPRLRLSPNDLVDWAHVGTAAVYCDIVVTEKRLADLLRRPPLKTKARVISDLRLLATG